MGNRIFFFPQPLSVFLIFFGVVRDIVFRVEDNVWMVSRLEWEVIDTVFLLGVESGVSGLFFVLVFAPSTIEPTVLRR